MKNHHWDQSSIHAYSKKGTLSSTQSTANPSSPSHNTISTSSSPPARTTPSDSGIYVSTPQSNSSAAPAYTPSPIASPTTHTTYSSEQVLSSTASTSGTKASSSSKPRAVHSRLTSMIFPSSR